MPTKLTVCGEKTPVLLALMAGYALKGTTTPMTGPTAVLKGPTVPLEPKLNVLRVTLESWSVQKL